MESSTLPINANPSALQVIVKAIVDMETTVSIQAKILPRKMPWQRSLADQLDTVDRLLQVLRLTIVLERQDPEILAAADALNVECRRTSIGVLGSRCDVETRAAVMWLAKLATEVSKALHAAQGELF